MAQRMLDANGGEASMILTTGKVWAVLEKNLILKPSLLRLMRESAFHIVLN